MGKPLPEQRVGFESVFRTETNKLRTRAAQPYNAAARQNDLETSSVGLALSGGGIRSAAFALGVVQALEACGGFGKIDYLSTVSGGGYTGAALTAGLRRGNGAFPFKTNTGETLEPADIADNKAVRDLRDRCRYLMPNGRFDLVVSLAIILRGLMVNAVIVACGVCFAAALTLFILPGEADLSTFPAVPAIHSISASIVGSIHSSLGEHFVITKLLFVTLALWLVAWAVFRSIATTAGRASDKALSDPASKLARGTGGLLLVIVAATAVEAQGPILSACVEWFGSPDRQRVSFENLRTFFAALAAGAGVVAVFRRLVVQAIQTAERDPTWSAFVKKLAAQMILFVAAATLPFVIYSLYLVAVVSGLKQSNGVPRAEGLFSILPKGPIRGVLAVLPVLWIACFASLQATWGPLADSVFRRSWWRQTAFREKGFFVGLIAILVTATFGVIFVAYFARQFVAALPLSDAAWSFLIAAFLLCLVAVLFTENANTLHRLYRDRLEQAFALSGDEQRLLISQLKTLANGATLRPYPIVNATVNIQASPENRRSRNADFFVFTPDHVGSDATGYVETREFEAAEPHMDLATAVAVSGAAVSSAMGRAGIAILSPTLTLLNLRLGLWVRNPRYAGTPAARSAASRGPWTVTYTLREMFGQLTATSKKVYVTDGGHIDNLGVYQLLKRRCELIIVSDAEQDPSLSFGAFVDVERFARIDLGVRFDLPLGPMREAVLERRALNESDPKRSYCAANTAHASIGTIQYPKTVDGLGAKEATILYVKACMTGDERDYVLDYERRHPRFPHEPTSDQFFTEEQFEAYRALGFHATSMALTRSDGSERWTRLLGGARTRLGI